MNINKENYEEYLFDYMEGNLSAEEHAELEKVIESDEFLKAELAAFEQTVLVPSDDVEYPYKDALLKEEKKRKIIPLYTYISVGVAAAISLLAIVYMPTADITLPNPVADNDNPKTISKEADKAPLKPSEDLTEEIAPITAESETNEAQSNTHTISPALNDKVNNGSRVVRTKFEKIDPITAYTANHTYPLKDPTKVNNPDYVEAPSWDAIVAATNVEQNSQDNNTDGTNKPLIPAFKQAVFEEAGDLWASIKKPSVKLFTRDNEGNKKLQLVLQYDTYQALIRVR